MRQRSSQSNSPSFLRLQHPSRMHKVGIAQEEPWHNVGLNCIRIDLCICWVLDRLAPYKLPRALDSLLIYQQPSSTTLYYSYQEHLFLTKARLRNETGGNYRHNLSFCLKGCLSSFVCVSHFLKTVHAWSSAVHEPARRVWGKWWCRWRMRTIVMSSLGSELVGRTTKDDDVGKEIEQKLVNACAKI